MKLRFTVRDTGIGIPEDKLGLLFDKFSQVDAGITRKFGGTGLGLAISRQLAGLMGGEVGVRSTPGQGSAFWFTARFGLQESPPNLTFTHPRELSGLHVLVVDDNATNLEILVKQFTAWGMRPQGVDSGQAALDAAAKAHDLSDPFDLAVVDFQMPGMDGGELGKRLKADPRFQAMPLIMLTSLGRPGDARMCADLGFSAYLNKPVRQSELHDTLALALADTDQRTPAQPIITRHMARENQRRQLAYPRFSGRILLAEDNPVNQQVALGILKKMGLRADAVGNGLEALHALLTLPYDLVFMDVQMPDMDGLEATKRIRIQESGVWSQESDDRGWSSCPQVSGLSPHPSRRLPVIALTAGAMTEDRETCLEAGMDDYVSKPVSPMELARVLEKWLPVVQDGGQKAEVRGQGSEVRDQESEIRGQKPENEEQEEENVSSEEIRSVEQPIAGEEQAGGEKALPVFDRAALLERFMGDENLLAQVMGLTLENVPVRIQEIRAALEKNDASGVRLAAHTIKGMAANTSAGALREVAGEMEQAAQAGDLDAVRDRMGVLEERFEALREMAGG